MTRINTNVSSLNAQKTLSRSNSALQESLTRLSTGLRINKGKDDPAGLIASESLRSDIISVQKAITNSERANQLIATADSALGQVSSLLNDIRGLVSESANTGALSDEQIAANQLQIDSSLEAIDRIAQTTSFQGRRLLDGSLDFLSSSVDGFSTGTVGNTAAVKASGTVGDIDGTAATATISRGTINAATGTIGAAGVSDFTLTADIGGSQYNGVSVIYQNSVTAGNEVAVFDANANTITVQVQNATSTVTQVVSAINAQLGATFTASALTGAGTVTAGTAAGSTAGGTDLASFTLTADNNNASFNGLSVIYQDSVTAGNETAAYDSTANTLTVQIQTGVTTGNQIVTAINAQLGSLFTAANGTNGNGPATTGTATGTLAGGNGGTQISLTAKENGDDFNGNFVVTTNATTQRGDEQVSYSAGVFTVTANNSSTTADIVAAINRASGAQYSASLNGGQGGGTFAANSTTTFTNALSGGEEGSQFTLTSTTAGSAYDDVDVAFVTDGALNAGEATVEFNSVNKRLTISHNAATVASVVNAINDDETVGALFQAGLLDDGSGSVTTSTDDTSKVTSGGGLGAGSLSGLRIEQASFGTASSVNVDVEIDRQATKASLVYAAGNLAANTTLEIGGVSGFKMFDFGANTTTQQIADALNQESDATGVTASVNADTGELTLSSSEYGSKAFVSARALTGSFATTNSSDASATRASGTDVSLRINGIAATGDGLQASINTSSLDITFSVSEDLTDGSRVQFDITGGGATFQIGPDVVSNQQARLGIQGVSTSTLGGASGKLRDLRSGGQFALATDVKGAAAVVDEVITSVTQLRGRLGAFQKTTLETNIYTLNDTLENLTEAESSIRDADFAAESARLTRAQILVQSGTSVLSIANSNPQNVLSLLRG